jgi:formylglycine-generating enzyme required for sulfatase activity
MRHIFRVFWTRRCPGLAAFAVIVSFALLSACNPDGGTEPEEWEPPVLREGFAAVPGGTVTGSGAYTITVTIPGNGEYLNQGTSAVCKGVFVAGRTLTIPAFAMAAYETTQELWYTVQEWAVGRDYTFQNPKANAPAEAQKNWPVTGVSWRDVVVWCNAYSEKDGLAPVYLSGGGVLRDSRNANAAACNAVVMDKTRNGYRLPTEAEREYAARGGDPGKPDWMYPYAGGNDPDTVAWHHGNSPYQVKDVGRKTPNRLGIYDLSGNVQEWGWDWMHYAREAAAATPLDGESYSAQFNQKPMMGGGVGSNLTYSCVAKRWSYTPSYTSSYIGFRVVYPL